MKEKQLFICRLKNGDGCAGDIDDEDDFSLLVFKTKEKAQNYLDSIYDGNEFVILKAKLTYEGYEHRSKD